MHFDLLLGPFPGATRERGRTIPKSCFFRSEGFVGGTQKTEIPFWGFADIVCEGKERQSRTERKVAKGVGKFPESQAQEEKRAGRKRTKCNPIVFKRRTPGVFKAAGTFGPGILSGRVGAFLLLPALQTGKELKEILSSEPHGALKSLAPGQFRARDANANAFKIHKVGSTEVDFARLLAL